MKAGHLVPVLVSAALPGCGHIAAGRPVKGLLLFFLFGFAIDGFFYSQAQSILPPDHMTVAPRVIRTVALGGGAVLWLFAVVDTAVLALRRRRVETRRDEATALIREALVAYLRADYRAATKALQAALRINDHDPDALYHLGVVYAAAGDRRKARRALRRCIRYDDGGKWHTEASDQLRTLQAAHPPSTKAKPAASKGEQGETNA